MKKNKPFRELFYCSLRKILQITRIAAALLIMGVLQAYAGNQQNRITGTVSDKAGLGLPGVNVVVTGTTAGAMTDIDGKYNLDVPAGSKSLTFSFIGMQSQEIEIGAKTQINVTLEEAALSLNEVVVIGYGTTSRRNNASATVALKNDEIVGTSTTDTRQALQGKISGVRVVNNSGDPGSGAKIVIRGIGSFSKTDPLYVIDGIQGGDINAVPPQNIENITVLKDAATTAIYGAAAANGVVIVTTKGGIKGQVKVSYDGGIGLDVVTKRLDLLNASDYVDLVTDIQTSNGQAITAKLATPEVRLDVTDWQDVMFRNATSTEHNLSFSGGSDNSTYSIAAGYQKKESTVIDNTFQRLTLNAKLGQDLFKKRVRLTQNLRIKNDISDGLTAGFNNGVRMAPYTALYDATNLGGFGRMDKPTDLQDANNPLDEVTNTDFKSRQFYTDVDFSGEVTIIEGFKFKSQGRLSFWNYNDYRFNKPTNQGNFTRTDADIAENFGFGTDVIIENFFSYAKSFGDHDLSATLGNTWDPSSSTRSINALGSSYTSIDIENLGLGNTKSISGTKVNSNASRLSYYGRLSYTYKGKYIFNGSLRRDASSKFGANNRWGTFYGIGVAWAISEEDFLKSIPVISDLKLRGSYGKLGNDNIPSFQGDYSVWRGEANNIVYSFGDNTSFANGSSIYFIPNPDLKWEETKQLDIGLDLGLMNNKVTFVFDYFKRNNQDLLIQTALPLTTGTGTPGKQGTQWINAAGMHNSGLELAVTYTQNTGLIKWDVSLNATYSTNEVTALGTAGNLPIISGNFIAGVGESTRTDIGLPISSFYGYVYDHVISTTEELNAINAATVATTGGVKTQFLNNMKAGDRLFKDINGNGYLDAGDRTYIGNPSPKWQYGASFSATFKNFDFSTNLSGVAGVDLINGNKYWWLGMSKPFNQTTGVLDRWRAEGDVADNPRAGQNSSSNLLSSSWYVEKGDYLKVQNVAIGYSLPIQAFQKIRIYASIQNVLTITKYTGFDPEVSSNTPQDDRSFIFFNGIDLYQHPNPRVYRLGLQLNF